MTYEVGQKVETPLGVGEIKKIETWHDGHIQFVVWINDMGVRFVPRHLQPYKTPHDKLMGMGYELIQGANIKIYRHDKLSDVRVYDDNTISCNEIDLELAKIIKEYLEWLEEEK